MNTHRTFGPWAAVLLVALLGLTACTYDAALRQLSPPEQAEFALYHYRMTGWQEHTYLAKASAAERTAYLRELGLVQRFHSMIKFFVLDGLLRGMVAVSTDPARDSALPHPSSLDQPASYRDPIVRRLLGLVRLKLSSIPMGLSRAPMAWRR